MANILSSAEAAVVLRCETTDPDMLQLLPLVDAYIKNATGRDWSLDSTIYPEAKGAARILLTRWHEDPGGINNSLGPALAAALTQLEARALELETLGVPDEALAISASQPADGAIGVAIGANLVIIFNHKMDSTATSAVSVETAAGASVATTNSLDATGKILTINPTANLSINTQYRIILDHPADEYGQTLDTELSFWTED